MTKKLSQRANVPPIPPFLAGEDKRSVILRAAHTLFLRDGFSVTSMDAVTKEAGVSKATVYAHFDSKNKLFEELIRGGSEGTLQSLPPLVRLGGEPADELSQFFDPFLNVLIGCGGYAWSRLVIAEAVRHPELAELFFKCTLGRIASMVEDYFRVLSVERQTAFPEPRLAAESFLAVVLLGPLQRVLLLGPAAVDHRAALQFGIKMFFPSANPRRARPVRAAKDV